MPTSAPSYAAARRGRLLVLLVPERRHLTVLVAGEIDCATGPLLREGCTRSLFYRPRSVLVDATDVTFCDLSGLDALADGVAAVERSGVHVTVQRSAPIVQLDRLVTAVGQRPVTSGRPGPDPAGCPLPSAAWA